MARTVAIGLQDFEKVILLDECGLPGKKDCVKEWYDGFIFQQGERIWQI